MDNSNVSADELESVEGEPLPDREAMSILPIAADPLGAPLPIDPVENPGGGGNTLPVEPPAES